MESSINPLSAYEREGLQGGYLVHDGRQKGVVQPLFHTSAGAWIPTRCARHSPVQEPTGQRGGLMSIARMRNGKDGNLKDPARVFAHDAHGATLGLRLARRLDWGGYQDLEGVVRPESDASKAASPQFPPRQPSRGDQTRHDLLRCLVLRVLAGNFFLPGLE